MRVVSQDAPNTHLDDKGELQGSKINFCRTASRMLNGPTFLNIGKAVTNSPCRHYIELVIHDYA